MAVVGGSMRFMFGKHLMLVPPVTVGLVFKDKLTNLSPLQVVWRLPQDNGLLIDWMEVHIAH